MCSGGFPRPSSTGEWVPAGYIQSSTTSASPRLSPVLVSGWPLLHVPADCGPGPAQQIQMPRSLLCWEEAPATQLL